MRSATGSSRRCQGGWQGPREIRPATRPHLRSGISMAPCMYLPGCQDDQPLLLGSSPQMPTREVAPRLLICGNRAHRKLVNECIAENFHRIAGLSTSPSIQIGSLSIFDSAYERFLMHRPSSRPATELPPSRRVKMRRRKTKILGRAAHG
jgi:hypothetical protein